MKKVCYFENFLSLFAYPYFLLVRRIIKTAQQLRWGRPCCKSCLIVQASRTPRRYLMQSWCCGSTTGWAPCWSTCRQTTLRRSSAFWREETAASSSRGEESFKTLCHFVRSSLPVQQTSHVNLFSVSESKTWIQQSPRSGKSQSKKSTITSFSPSEVKNKNYCNHITFFL